MKLYCIPGLGFDRSIFEKIDFSGHDVTFIDWKIPLPNETLRAYAKRMAAVMMRDEKTVLIGHSFGGMLIQEIATFKKIEKVILVASIKSRAEMPLQLKIIKPLGIHRLFSKEITLFSFPFWAKMHGYNTKAIRDTFVGMIEKQDNIYLQWALKAVSVWEAPTLPPSTKLIHIHGSKDKTFPFSLIQNPDYVVENGSHVMLLSFSAELNRVFRECLER